MDLWPPLRPTTYANMRAREENFLWPTHGETFSAVRWILIRAFVEMTPNHVQEWSNWHNPIGQLQTRTRQSASIRRGAALDIYVGVVDAVSDGFSNFSSFILIIHQVMLGLNTTTRFIVPSAEVIIILWSLFWSLHCSLHWWRDDHGPRCGGGKRPGHCICLSQIPRTRIGILYGDYGADVWMLCHQLSPTWTRRNHSGPALQWEIYQYPWGCADYCTKSRIHLHWCSSSFWRPRKNHHHNKRGVPCRMEGYRRSFSIGE